jgi:hypothetical protein
MRVCPVPVCGGSLVFLVVLKFWIDGKGQQPGRSLLIALTGILYNKIPTIVENLTYII